MIRQGQGDEGANLSEYERSEDVPPEVEATLLAVWRRVLNEGSGPELTLPEAAVLLGTSVESVRRRIKAGQIRAFHDERGRVRIVATVTPPKGLALPEQPHEQEQQPGLARLWQELKAARNSLDDTVAENVDLRERLARVYDRSEDMRRELNQTRSEAQVLQDELDNAREALEYTQGELASMWRVMSSRTERMERAHSLGLTDGNEAFDLSRGHAGMSEERLRIQAQISRVRDLSRRRRWPWPQAS
jgi:predicted RNase H-like nuclease (RuvC/YqgF family)